MKRLRIVALCGTLGWVSTLAPAVALAQGDQGGPSSELTPPSPPPAESPPPPTEASPTPPAQGQPAPAAQVPPGQWIYTQQYGWIWSPYGESFTYVPPNGVGEPLVYVYYPAFGWRWIVGPWVWGVGPWPYFGVRGPALFGWYRIGWWRTPARWHFRPVPARPGFVEHSRGVRPAPPRVERRFHEHERGRR